MRVDVSQNGYRCLAQLPVRDGGFRAALLKAQSMPLRELAAEQDTPARQQAPPGAVSRAEQQAAQALTGEGQIPAEQLLEWIHNNVAATYYHRGSLIQIMLAGLPPVPIPEGGGPSVRIEPDMLLQNQMTSGAQQRAVAAPAQPEAVLQPAFQTGAEAVLQWVRENGGAAGAMARTPMDAVLSEYVMNHFSVGTTLASLPQTAVPAQAQVLPAPGGAALTALPGPALAQSAASDGVYTLSAAVSNDVLTVTAAAENGQTLTAALPAAALAQTPQGQSLTLTFLSEQGEVFTLLTPAPARGEAESPLALARLAVGLRGAQVTLAGGRPALPAVFAQTADFPGASSVPLEGGQGVIQMENGLTLSLASAVREQMQQTAQTGQPAPQTAQNAPQTAQSGAPQENPAGSAAQPAAPAQTGTATPERRAAAFTASVPSADARAAPAQTVLTRTVLSSPDAIEAGPGSPVPLFEADSGVGYAAFTLTAVSPGSPLEAQGGGTLRLIASSGGGDLTLTLLAEQTPYSATVTAARLESFSAGTVARLPIVFQAAAGGADSVTLTLAVAMNYEQDLKRQQRQQQAPPLSFDAQTLGLAGAAATQTPRKPRARRMPRKTLVGQMILTASTLTMDPAGVFLGSVSALVQTMADAEEDDDKNEEKTEKTQEISDSGSARDRAERLNRAVRENCRAASLAHRNARAQFVLPLVEEE